MGECAEWPNPAVSERGGRRPVFVVGLGVGFVRSLLVFAFWGVCRICLYVRIMFFEIIESGGVVFFYIGGKAFYFV